MPELLQLVSDGSFHPERATARVAAWDEAAEALAEHDAKLVLTR
jgi:hypothetical protein